MLRQMLCLADAAQLSADVEATLLRRPNPRGLISVRPRIGSSVSPSSGATVLGAILMKY